MRLSRPLSYEQKVNTCAALNFSTIKQFLQFIPGCPDAMRGRCILNFLRKSENYVYMCIRHPKFKSVLIDKISEFKVNAETLNHKLAPEFQNIKYTEKLAWNPRMPGPSKYVH